MVSKARKTSRTKPRSAARKGTRGARAKGGGKIELRPIRMKLKDHVSRLKRAEQTRQVKNALRRLQRCLAEIQKTCGPNMMIPLG